MTVALFFTVRREQRMARGYKVIGSRGRNSRQLALRAMQFLKNMHYFWSQITAKQSLTSPPVIYSHDIPLALSDQFVTR